MNGPIPSGHQGPRSAADLKATAYHEAGHAVVKAVLELHVESVSIVPDDDALGECTSPPIAQYGSRTKSEERDLAQDHIIVCYAGPEAQKLVDPAPEPCHSEADEESALDISMEYGLTPRRACQRGDEAHMKYLDKFRKEARRLIQTHRRAVEAVAEELLRKHCLNHQEVLNCIARAKNSTIRRAK